MSNTVPTKSPPPKKKKNPGRTQGMMYDHPDQNSPQELNVNWFLYTKV